MRDIVGVAQDLHRLYTIAKVACSSMSTFSEREIEMSEKFRVPRLRH